MAKEIAKSIFNSLSERQVKDLLVILQTDVALFSQELKRLQEEREKEKAVVEHDPVKKMARYMTAQIQNAIDTYGTTIQPVNIIEYVPFDEISRKFVSYPFSQYYDVLIEAFQTHEIVGNYESERYIYELFYEIIWYNKEKVEKEQVDELIKAIQRDASGYLKSYHKKILILAFSKDK